MSYFVTGWLSRVLLGPQWWIFVAILGSQCENAGVRTLGHLTSCLEAVAEYVEHDITAGTYELFCFWLLTRKEQLMHPLHIDEIVVCLEFNNPSVHIHRSGLFDSYNCSILGHNVVWWWLQLYIFYIFQCFPDFPDMGSWVAIKCHFE